MAAIRIVVVGCGSRSTWGINAILSEPRFHLVGLVDIIPPKAEFLAKHFGIAGHVSTYSCLADCSRAIDYDAIAVFTPDGTHAEVAVPELESGRWVFVEKPLDITAERVAAIISADTVADGKTFVGMNLRFAPLYRMIYSLIQSGLAGRLLTIQADEFYDGGRTYFRRWNRARSHSGGLWVTKSCHDFDLICWLAGAKPISVFARSNLTHYVPRPDAASLCRDCQLLQTCPDRYDLHLPADSLAARLNQITEAATGRAPDLCLYNSEKDTFDHGSALIELGDGLVATYTVNVVAGFTNRRIRVSGTAATIDGDLSADEIIIHYRNSDKIERIQVGKTGEAHGGGDGFVFRTFADFIAGDQDNIVRPAEAAVGVRLALAAQLSCDTGSPVEIAAMS